MLEFVSEGLVPKWVNYTYLISYCIFCIVFFKYLRNNKISAPEKKITIIAVLSFFTVCAVFYCINSDYFNYRYWVERYDLLDASSFSKESIYLYIAKVVSGDYDLFRLVVWGGAILLTALATKKADAKIYPAIALWFIFYYDKVCYARASLAMAFYVLGVVLLCKESDSSKVRILGLISALLSISFHKSMIIVVMVLPILFFKLTKQRIVVYALLLIVLELFLFSVFDFSDMFEDSAEDVVNEYADKVNGYTASIEAGRFGAHNFSNYVKLLWRYSLFYVPFVVITNTIFKRENLGCFSDSLVSIYKVTVGVMLVATTFMFVFGFGNPFFYRILYVSASLIAIITTKLYQERFLNRKVIKNLCYNSIACHIVLIGVGLATH